MPFCVLRKQRWCLDQIECTDLKVNDREAETSGRWDGEGVGPFSQGFKLRVQMGTGWQRVFIWPPLYTHTPTSHTHTHMQGKHCHHHARAHIRTHTLLFLTLKIAVTHSHSAIPKKACCSGQICNYVAYLLIDNQTLSNL